MLLIELSKFFTTLTFFSNVCSKSFSNSNSADDYNFNVGVIIYCDYKNLKLNNIPNIQSFASLIKVHHIWHCW